MSRKIVLGLLLLLLALFFISDRFFYSKLNFFSFLDNLKTEGEASQRIAELERENKNLKFELLNQKTKKPNTVKVYSIYPFSNRADLAIAAGAKSGVKAGDVITYGENILIGKVVGVYDNMSIVTTTFNPSWKSAVRIGEHQIDALLQGGNEMTVTLIPIEADVHDGEPVITASQDLPYGLGVGTLKDIRTASGNAYKEATLEPSFQFKDLKDANLYR